MLPPGPGPRASPSTGGVITKVVSSRIRPGTRQDAPPPPGCSRGCLPSPTGSRCAVACPTSSRASARPTTAGAGRTGRARSAPRQGARSGESCGGHAAYRGGPLNCRALMRAAPSAARGAPSPGSSGHHRAGRLLRRRVGEGLRAAHQEGVGTGRLGVSGRRSGPRHGGRAFGAPGARSGRPDRPRRAAPGRRPPTRPGRPARPHPRGWRQYLGAGRHRRPAYATELADEGRAQRPAPQPE